MAEKTLSLLDIHLSAFLSLHGLQPELKINDGRVTFNFPVMDNLYKLMDAYNSNAPTPIADFVVSVKILRGQMLTLKGGGGQKC